MDFIKEIPKVYLFIELLYYQSLKETTEQNKTNKERNLDGGGTLGVSIRMRQLGYSLQGQLPDLQIKFCRWLSLCLYQNLF